MPCRRATLRQLAALLVPGAVAAGAPLAVAVSDEPLSVGTTTPGAVVRAVLGRLLLAVLDRRGGEVRIRADDGGVVVEAVASGGAIALDPRTTAAAAAAGIRLDDTTSTFTLTFPSPAASLRQREATHGIA